VLGHDVPPNAFGRGGLPWVEAEMLRVAHERALEPPMPAWLAQWKEESAATERARAEARVRAGKQEAEAWAAALETCGIPADQLEVRPNIRSRQVRSGMRQELRHVVPLVDAPVEPALPPGRPGAVRGQPLADAGRRNRRAGHLRDLPQVHR
jgi:hypothetical protein